MAAITLQPDIRTFVIRVPSIDLKRFKGLVKVMGWTLEEKTDDKQKSELDICLDEIQSGNVIKVGSVDNLMQYLHS